MNEKETQFICLPIAICFSGMPPQVKFDSRKESLIQYFLS